VEKSRQLSHKIGYHSEITSPMTLAAIYNQDEKDFNPVKKRKQLGFRRGEISHR